MKVVQVVLVLLLAAVSHAFAPSQQQKQHGRHAFLVTPSFHIFMAKGFGDEDTISKTTKKKSAGQLEREKKASQYDQIAATGGQEYSVYVRQFGGDDKSWLPCGAIAVKRDGQVSDAIFGNETPLKTAIVRTYPKLKGFEDEFEFGYNLKVYPDDPIEVATKGGPKVEGFSIGNWVSTLLSPIDASKVPPPPTQE